MTTSATIDAAADEIARALSGSAGHPAGTEPDPRAALAAYVYVEATTTRGAEETDSDSKLAYKQARGYWLSHLEPAGVSLSEEQLIDVTVGDKHTPFAYRKMGRRLIALARPGDHVVFARCPCRRCELQDFDGLLALWASMDVTVHIAELDVDLASEAGRILTRAFQLIVKGQRDVKSRQNLIIAERSRKMGRPTNGSKRVGYRLERRYGVRYWVADMEERGILCEIQRLREQEAKTWEQVSHEIARWLAKDGNSSSLDYWRRQWSRQRCCNRYHKWLEIQREERAAGLLGDADADGPGAE